MEIRRLEEKDIEHLVDFILDVYDEYPLAMWFDIKPSRQDIESVFRNKLEGMEYDELVDFVAEEGGRIVGECELVKIDDDIGIIGIIIRKEHSRKGLGTQMLDSAAEAGERIGISKIIVEVLERNTPALNFFKSNGFIPAATRPIERGSKMENLVLFERI